MMVSEICNSLKEEKEDASSTNCVLEERDIKSLLSRKKKNKNKKRNAHLRGVPDLFVLFSQSKHRRRLRRRRRRKRERERVMRFGASTKEKSDDDGECRFCVSTTLRDTTKKGKKRSK